VKEPACGQRLSRRHFLKSAGAAAFPYIIPSAALGKAGSVAPSNRIVMASIGVGGQGDRDMRSFLEHRDVQLVAVCDVDSGSRNYEQGWYRGRSAAVEAVTDHYAKHQRDGTYSGCGEYGDYRELLARDDIDAVSIATPDHWHAVIAVAAAKSGKDIYCQKPLSLTIPGGRAIADAVSRYGRVFQCGSQRRSDAACRRSCELVRNGRIGKLHTVRVGLPGGHSNPGYSMPATPMAVPEGFDYDMWLGPAPFAPYTHKRCHWTFRWILDYSGGQVTDWGAHFVDMAHWGMGTEHTGPIEVEGRGTFPNETTLWNTATSFHFECKYANGVNMIVSSRGGGVRFEGSDGWIDLAGATQPESIGTSVIGPHETRLYVSREQHANFVDCVKSRRPTAAPAEVAHRSITPSHLGNIAMQLGRKIRWDPDTEQIIGDETASRMLTRPMRAPWRL